MVEPVFESVNTFEPDEFAAWVSEREERGDVNHYELLNGRIVMAPPAGWPHGSIESAIVVRIGAFVRAHGLGKTFGSSQGFQLPSGDVVEPDISFVSAARMAEGPAPVAGKFLCRVPDLVVEILSPSTVSRDRGEKRGIYARNGVREYWLVDPRSEQVTVLVLDGPRFAIRGVYERETIVESAVLTGLELPVAEIFD